MTGLWRREVPGLEPKNSLPDWSRSKDLGWGLYATLTGKWTRPVGANWAESLTPAFPSTSSLCSFGSKIFAQFVIFPLDLSCIHHR